MMKKTEKSLKCRENIVILNQMKLTEPIWIVWFIQVWIKSNGKLLGSWEIIQSVAHVLLSSPWCWLYWNGVHSKEVQIVYRLFLVNCYLLHVPRLPSQPVSSGRGWVIDFIWLELAWQYIAMTRNNLCIISISLATYTETPSEYKYVCLSKTVPSFNRDKIQNIKKVDKTFIDYLR